MGSCVHAEDLLKKIEDAGFFEGRYKGRVITVHSNQKWRGEGRNGTAIVERGRPGESDRDRHPRQYAERGLGRDQPLHHRSVTRRKLKDSGRAVNWTRTAPAVW